MNNERKRDYLATLFQCNIIAHNYCLEEMDKMDKIKNVKRKINRKIKSNVKM